MERHVIIFAPKYVIITKHVSNTNTRGVNGFSAICFHKSRAFPDEKKREISAGGGIPDEKKERVHGFLRGLCRRYRTRKDQKGPERSRTGPERSRPKQNGTRKKHS